MAKSSIKSEKFIELLMIACSLISVLTTLGIILVLSIDTIKFFAEVSFFSFITDTQWTPLFADKHFGILPLLTGTIDRKSTRLNSSHVKISYAVFCLKKKHAPVIPLPRL